MTLTSEQLIALISEHPWGVPVRDMEALLALGDEGVEPLRRFFEDPDLSHSGETDLLWPLVVLGELRDPRFMPTLFRVLREAQGLELPIAAAEALAKLGFLAIPAIEELLDEKSVARTRILAYMALAHMDHPHAWEILEGALENDPELDFAVARALAERNLSEDQERVYRAYCEAESWKRSAFEETLTGMISGRPTWSTPHRDWRLRYRRQPKQGLRIFRSWPDVMVLLWENRHELRPSASTVPYSMEQLRQRADQRREESVCQDCGEPFRSPTGVPLCGEAEEDLIEFQLQRIRDWMDDRWEDIHEILDELDHQEMGALQWPEETDEERAYKNEALDSIDVVKSTLCWMVEEGLAGLSQGERRLWLALQRARSRD
jgi:hypothetical protein